LLAWNGELFRPCLRARTRILADFSKRCREKIAGSADFSPSQTESDQACVRTLDFRRGPDVPRAFAAI